MATGDGLQWSSYTLIGKAIQLATRDKINHFGLVIRFREFLEDRIFTLEALESGIVLRSLRERLESHRGKCWWLPLKPKFIMHRKFVGAAMLSYAGVRYDYPDLCMQLFGRVDVDPRLLFCSEYGQICWEDSGILPTSRIAYQPKHMNKLGVTLPRIKIL